MLQHQENNTEEQVYAIFAPESNRTPGTAQTPPPSGPGAWNGAVNQGTGPGRGTVKD